MSVKGYQVNLDTLLREADPTRGATLPEHDSPVARAAFDRQMAVEPTGGGGLRSQRPWHGMPPPAAALRWAAAGSRWRAGALAAGGALAGAATAVAVVLSGVSAPSQPTYTLDAFLKVHPPAHPGDAAAVLRRLAARAAAQPAQALGPVEYSSNRQWVFVGENIPRNLHYFPRKSGNWTNQAWAAVSGASAVRSVRNSDGKVFTSSYPASYDSESAREGAWFNPATLPASLPALRQRLLDPPGADQTYWGAIFTDRFRRPDGKLGPPLTITRGEYTTRLAVVRQIRADKKQAQHDHDVITNVRIHKIGPGFLLPGTIPIPWQTTFATEAIRLMSGEPLSAAVHSAMLQVLAQIAANPGRGYTYVDMGTATDHLGRTGMVIGQEEADFPGPHFVGVQSLIFDPRTGALLDVANAQCEIPMGAIPRATGQCAPGDYTEYNAPKAVPSVPHYPAHDPGMYHQTGGPYP